MKRSLIGIVLITLSTLVLMRSAHADARFTIRAPGGGAGVAGESLSGIKIETPAHGSTLFGYVDHIGRPPSLGGTAEGAPEIDLTSTTNTLAPNGAGSGICALSSGATACSNTVQTIGGTGRILNLTISSPGFGFTRIQFSPSGGPSGNLVANDMKITAVVCTPRGAFCLNEKDYICDTSTFTFGCNGFPAPNPSGNNNEDTITTNGFCVLTGNGLACATTTGGNLPMGVEVPRKTAITNLSQPPGNSTIACNPAALVPPNCTGAGCTTPPGGCFPSLAVNKIGETANPSGEVILSVTLTSKEGIPLLNNIKFAESATSGIFFVPPPVPEPSSMLLLGSGVLGLAGILRRKLM